MRPDLSPYFTDLKHNRLLDESETRRLIALAQGGCTDSRTKVVVANLRLVVKLAGGYKRHHMYLDELIAEGNLGLFAAVDGFDLSLKVKFSTYAVLWIRHYIRQLLCEPPLCGVVHVPRRLMYEYLRDPANMKADIRKAIETSQSPRLQVYDTNVTVRCDPAEGLIAAEAAAAAHHMLRMLTERERTIVKARFGIGQDVESLTEVAEQLGITKERVRQIQQDAIRKMRGDV